MAETKQQEDGLLQKLIAFQAENDDEFDIQVQFTVMTAEFLKYYANSEYKDNLREILQKSLNLREPVYVKISDQIAAKFTVTPLFHKTRDYIRDPFHGSREPHDMHFLEDRQA